MKNNNYKGIQVSETVANDTAADEMMIVELIAEAVEETHLVKTAMSTGDMDNNLI